MKPGTKMKNFSNTADDDKPKKRKPTRRVDPFSPWQLLVEGRRDELKISTRTLASRVGEKSKKYEHTTIWAWLRSPEGTPPGDIYTAELNAAISEALSVSPEVLAAAFEESRRKFVVTTVAASQQGPLNVLRALFSGSKQTTWTTDQIVQLIDDLRGY